MFPAGFTSGEGDIFGTGCQFFGPSLFLEGCVFEPACFFWGVVGSPIVFGKGNVFGENCTFQNVIWGMHNVVGDNRIDLGGNTSVPGSETLFGGEDMFTLNRAHIQTTGATGALLCEDAVINNEHGATVDHEPYCPSRQVSTYVGSQGDSGTPATIERLP